MSGDAQQCILVVEDEAKIAALLQDYLKQAGFQTHWLARGDEVAPWVREHPPALILLDLMLPGLDGMGVCREVRAFSHVPIVMVTARVEEIDRLLGLELGADDYICKPFSPREVVARVKAILRRARCAESGEAPGSRLVLDSEKYSAVLDGHPLDLTPLEFRLLSILYSHLGRVFSRDQLMDSIYEDHRIVTDRTVDSHIKNLRKKMQAVTTDDEDLIRSIYGVGYKLQI